MSSLPKSLWPFFCYFMRKEWKLLLFFQLLCLPWALDWTLWPVIIGMVVDTLTHFAGDRADIWIALVKPIIFSIAMWVGMEAIFRVNGFVMARLWPRLEATIRMSLFNYVQGHSYTYFANHFAGSLANRISDMCREFLSILERIMSRFIPTFIGILITCGLLAAQHLLYAAIMLFWIVLHLILTLFFAKRCTKYADIHAEARTALVGKIVDSLTNYFNVRLFARTRFESTYLSGFQKEEQQKHEYARRYVEYMKAILGSCFFLFAGFLLNWLMIYGWQHNWISTGAVVLIFTLTWNATMLVWQSSCELPQLFQEIGICQQALQLVQHAHDIVDSPQASKLQVTRGEIVFEKVSFSYSKDRKLFQDKTVRIQGGEKVGLVGFSGSGKSTFVHLLLRFFDVQAGRILIDGQNIAEVQQDSLHEQISMIPQDTALFHRSLMENIRYGRLEASDAEIIEASKKAHCHEFIMQMPRGYDSLVGERGVKLSGGQRQRIAIARAILKNAPILILDEATSALDSVTEGYIQSSLADLMHEKTCIVIAHRLSTLSGMDRILVFQEGRIVEIGNHAELLQHKGHYAEMWKKQVGGFLPL